MGRLDEPSFENAVRACPSCHGTRLEIRSFIDRRYDVMLADPNDDGVWAHDGEKFVDGTYLITCLDCGCEIMRDDMCPRCHRAGGLERALADESRFEVPARCPACNETELRVLALIPATVRYVAGRADKPEPLALFGDAGHHIVAFGCEDCDVAQVTPVCPLCDEPGPLRARP